MDVECYTLLNIPPKPTAAMSATDHTVSIHLKPLSEYIGPPLHNALTQTHTYKVIVLLFNITKSKTTMYHA